MSYELLHKNGLKITEQRKQVIDAIIKLKLNATTKNIVKNCSNINPSTVYRIIDLLLNKDLLEKSFNEYGETFYALKDNHGHYFTCLKCGRKEKLDSCPIDEIKKNYEKEKGYTILNHTVLLSGICKKCQ